MHLLRNIIKNFSILTLGQAISGALNFYAVVLLAKRLGVDGFGIFSFTESVFMFFVMFVVFGTDFLGSRKVAQDEHRTPQFASEIILFRFWTSFLAFAAILVFTFVLNRPLLVKMTLLVFGATLFTFTFLLNWLYLGLQKLKIVSVGNIIRELVFLSGIVFFVHRGSDLLIAAYIFLVSRLMHASFFILIFIRKFGIPRFQRGHAELRALLKDSFPILFSAFEGWIVSCFDIIFLIFYLGAASAGFYSAAFKPIFLLITICSIYFLSVFPVLSKSALYNEADFKKIILFTLYGMMGIWFPIAILGYQSADWLIPFMYNLSYAESIPVFKVLVVALMIVPLNLLYSRSLISCGRQKENSLVSVIIIVSNIVLNLFLIPRYGLLGAAFAKVASWSIALPFYHGYLIRRVKFSLFAPFSGPFTASVTMVMIIILFNFLSQWLRLLAAAFGYLIVFSFFTVFWLRREHKKTLVFDENTGRSKS